MMIRYILFCLYFTSFIYSQNDVEQVNVAVYKFAANTDFSTTEQDILQKIEHSTVEAALYFNSYKSIYKVVNKMRYSGINDKDTRLTNSLAGRGLWYKNINTKIRINQRESLFVGEDRKMTLVNIVYPYNEYKWTITKERKTLSGFTCYKAVASVETQGIKGKIMRNVTAWFTPEVSTSFGPKGIDGLPGLIVFVNVSNKYFISLESIAFDVKDFKIELVEDVKSIPKKEYSSILREKTPFLDRFRN